MRPVLNQFASKQIGQHAVMRAAVAYNDWLVPAMYVGQVLGRTVLNRPMMFGERFAHPANTLWLYTDFEVAAAMYQRGAPLGPYEGGIPGSELFARIPPTLQAIAINEGALEQDKLYMRAPSFGNVGVWVDVMAFEASFAGPTTPAMVAAVKRYDAYFVATHNHDGSVVTMLNHGGMRNPGVLFTGPDSLAAFMARVGPQGAAGMTTGQTTGAQLFGMLASLGIDGITINPFGPGAARTFTLRELG